MRGRAPAVARGLVLALVVTAGAATGTALTGNDAAAQPGVAAVVVPEPTDGPTRTATATAVPALPPGALVADDPRLAFTDDRDRIGMAVVDRTRQEGHPAYGVERFEAAELPGSFRDDGSSVHTGELSAAPSSEQAGARVFVRTSPTNPAGDVYLVVTDVEGAEEAPLQVTCDNAAVETHPVVRVRGGEGGDDFVVAYTVDDGTGTDVWVSLVPSGSEDGACPPAQRVTYDPAGDLWPAWVPHDPTTDDDDEQWGLVFSSTRDDPLGNLYVVTVAVPSDGPLVGGDPGAELDLRQLTVGPAAETHPAVQRVFDPDLEESEAMVVFTTTEYRPDGSLASVRLPCCGGLPEVGPLWPDAADARLQSEWAPQSSEAQWSPDGEELLFTSTRDDPYGDVFLTRVSLARVVVDDAGAGVSRLVGLLPRDPTPVAALPGLSESHGAWLTGFTGGESDPSDTALVGFTFDALVADVAEDVLWPDGSRWRPIGATTLDDGTLTFDDAGPAYSPGGDRVAWSAKLAVPAGQPVVSRQIVIGPSASPPSGGVPLTTDRGPLDMDVDPAWSPDGTRIAFVRYPSTGPDSFGAPQIWTATVTTGAAQRVSPAPAPGTVRHDVDPSWSPDGTRLVISRQVVPVVDAGVEVTAEPARVISGGTSQVTVGVTIAEGTTSVRVHVWSPPSPQGSASVLRVGGGTLPAGCEAGAGGVVCHLDGVGQTVRTLALAVGVGSRGSPTAATNSVVATVTAEGHDPVGENDVDSVELTAEPSTISLAAPGRVVPGSVFTATTTVVVAPGPYTVNLPLPASVSPEAPSLPPRCVQQTVPRAVVCDRSTDDPPLDIPLVATSVGPLSLQALVYGIGGARIESNTVTIQVAEPQVEIGSVPALLGIQQRSAPRPGLGTVRTVDVAADNPLLVAAIDAAPLAQAVTRGAPMADRGRAEVWVIDVSDGSGEVLLTEPPGCSPVSVCPPPPLVGRSPAWSPDGGRIVLERDGALHVVTLAPTAPGTGPAVPESVTASGQITGMLPDGQTPSRSTLSVTEDPAWSPDGAEIALAGQPAGQPDQRGIYAVAPDGTGLRTVAQLRGPETEPAYQPYTDLVLTLDAAPATIERGTTTELKATVLNEGPGRAVGVELEISVPAGLEALSVAEAGCTVTAALLTCSLADLAPGGAPTVVVVTRGVAAGTSTVTATADLDSPERDVADNDASTVVTVTTGPGPGPGPVTISANVSAEVTLDRDEAWAGGRPVTATFTVRNTSLTTEATGITVVLTYPAFITSVTTVAPGCSSPTSCTVASIPPDGDVTVPVTLTFAGPEVPAPPPAAQPAPPVDDGPVPSDTGQVTVRVATTSTDPDAVDDADAAPVTLHHPSVRLLPRVAKPGTVVLAYGQNFPPGEQVRLSWTRGITSTSGPVVVGPDGTLRFPIPVVRRDQLGDRSLEATDVAVESPTPAAAAFGPVRGPMLVVPRSTSAAPVPELIGRG